MVESEQPVGRAGRLGRWFFEARWWALAAGAAAAAAVMVGPGLFFTAAGALAAAAGAMQLAQWAWRRSDIEAAPPFVASQWTRAGLVVSAVTLITGVAAINSGLNLLYLMFGCMIGCLLVSGVLSGRAVRGLDFRRVVLGRAFAGRPFTVVVEVRNKKRLLPSIAVVVSERLEGPGGPAEARALAPIVGPRRAARVELRLTAARRGRYEFDRYTASTRFPFGFFIKSLSWGRRQELVVYPALGRLRREPRGGGRDPRWSFRRRAAARMGAEEFHGLREFRPGDNPKWIHWRSSAKLAKTMVREMENQDAIDLAILLDTYAPDAAAAERLETAVSFAATLACEYARERRRLALVFFGPELTVLADVDLDETLRALALLKPSPRPTCAALLAEARAGGLLGAEALLVRLGGEAGPAGLAEEAVVLDVRRAEFAAWFEPPRAAAQGRAKAS